MGEALEKKETEFYRKNNFVPNIVMVDAIGRSGKGMLAHILSSFERVEKQHNLDIFEWVGILWRFGKITKDAAVTLLRIEADTRLYNAFISRDINFRPSDDTGVFKNAQRLKYFRRLFWPAGSEAVRRCVEDNPIFQTCVHDGIRNAELFFEAFNERLKMIYIVRDPVYIIYEWQKSKFGERIGTDPREFQLTIRHNSGAVPYTAAYWEDEYLEISPDDRVVALIDKHFRLNMCGYAALDRNIKDRVLCMNFEDLITNPLPGCADIAKFIGSKITTHTKRILKQECCPRGMDSGTRVKKIGEIKGRVSPKYALMLDKLLEIYDSRYWEK